MRPTASALATALALACTQEPAAPARPATTTAPPRPGALRPSSDACRDAPTLAMPGTTPEPGATACLPRDFRATRLRVRGGAIELCGLAGAATPSPRCYTIDPLANRITPVDASDAPRAAPARPVFDEPFAPSELAPRGARVSTRGGMLNVTGRGGQRRTAPARAVAFESLDNAVLAPWAGGCHAVLVGWRWPDLGATAVVDLGSTRVVGHAAGLPCAGP